MRPGQPEETDPNETPERGSDAARPNEDDIQDPDPQQQDPESAPAADEPDA